ncbi:hypothetical protein GOC87_26560 [Sinorhizobium meliloti]|nr:hypothetical protein [Sinorhizobium meliloti]MDW9707133.1 hypothetical protein [Sinorhizobium meliloti]MDW9933747.1 hypothetical protein [Sinorhizobium meliloti]MDX0284618.1 hypothetical protein [Sinorhizobium meliloti]
MAMTFDERHANNDSRLSAAIREAIEKIRSSVVIARVAAGAWRHQWRV